MPRQALFIVNSRSRSGQSQRDAALKALNERGISCTSLPNHSSEELSALISKASGAFDSVIVGGGDGTLNAAAFGIVEKKLPLGILPMGTANDLARTLNIPPNIEAAIEIIAQGQTRQIDLGLVNDKPFFNVASLGLSSELARVLTSDVKRTFGRLGYGLAAIKVLMRARPFSARIASDERIIRVRTLQIAIGNGRYYGGGNAVEKDAAIDDQRLDLYSLEFKRAWKLALMARSFRAGEHGAWEEVRAASGQKFEISTRYPRPVNADGEIVTHTPARFGIMPAAITVYAPK